MTRKIEIISKKYGKIYALIDEEDYEKISKYKWRLLKHHRKTYSTDYVRGRFEGKEPTVLLHRLILGITDKNISIDHINGNGLDNRKSNLRICKQSDNVKNARKHKKATSKYKGVRKTKFNTWNVRIQINKKRITVGNYKTEKEAAIAYNNTAIKYFGEFAVLNEVKND